MKKPKILDPNFPIASIELAAFAIFCVASVEVSLPDDATTLKNVHAGLQALADIKQGKGVSAVDDYHNKHSVMGTCLEQWQGQDDIVKERYRAHARVVLAAGGIKKPADPSTALRVLSYRPARQAYTPPTLGQSS